MTLKFGADVLCQMLCHNLNINRQIFCYGRFFNFFQNLEDDPWYLTLPENQIVPLAVKGLILHLINL